MNFFGRPGGLLNTHTLAVDVEVKGIQSKHLHLRYCMYIFGFQTNKVLNLYEKHKATIWCLCFHLLQREQDRENRGDAEREKNKTYQLFSTDLNATV